MTKQQLKISFSIYTLTFNIKWYRTLVLFWQRDCHSAYICSLISMFLLAEMMWIGELLWSICHESHSRIRIDSGCYHSEQCCIVKCKCVTLLYRKSGCSCSGSWFRSLKEAHHATKPNMFTTRVKHHNDDHDNENSIKISNRYQVTKWLSTSIMLKLLEDQAVLFTTTTLIINCSLLTNLPHPLTITFL